MCGRSIRVGLLVFVLSWCSLSSVLSQEPTSTQSSPSLASSVQTLYEIALRQQTDLIERRRVEDSLSFSYNLLSGDLTKAMLRLDSSDLTLTKLEANYATLRTDLTKSVTLSEGSQALLKEMKQTTQRLSEELKTLHDNLASISTNRQIELWVWRGVAAVSAVVTGVVVIKAVF